MGDEKFKAMAMQHYGAPMADARVRSLAALLSRVDAEAVERCARVVEKLNRKHEPSDDGWTIEGVRSRVRARAAAAIRASRSTLPTPAARAGEDEATEAKG